MPTQRTINDLPKQAIRFLLVALLLMTALAGCGKTTEPALSDDAASLDDFSGADIGNPAIRGSWSRAADGRFTLEAAGTDIQYASDQCYFVYRTWTGDFDVQVKVESLAQTDAWAKAGLMARASLAANSADVSVLATPAARFEFQYRPRDGALVVYQGSQAPVTYPNTFVRLRRRGNVFTAFVGTSGADWSQVGEATIALPATVLLGMPVTSHNPAQKTRATFFNLGETVVPVGAITGMDIGKPAIAGSLTVLSPTRFTVTAAGSDIQWQADQFYYAFSTRSGDFDVRAQVESLTQADPWSKAGLMARAALDSNSPDVAILATPAAHYEFQHRDAFDAWVKKLDTQASVTYPASFVRLVRSGDVFTAYTGSDGLHWALAGQATLTLPKLLYVGMAVTSHNVGATVTARFRNFGDTASPLEPASPGAPSPTPTLPSALPTTTATAVPAMPTPPPTQAVTPAPTATPSSSPTSSPDPTDRVPMGVNLEGLRDWSVGLLFADAAKMARPYGSVTVPYDASLETNGQTDGSGWPAIADFGAFFFTAVPHMDGTYALSFTGQARLEVCSSSAQVTIADQAYDAAKNRTTASVTLAPNATPGGNDQLCLLFRGAKVSDTRAGVTGVSLMRPGAAPGDLFYKPFLDKLAPFSVLRTMDITNTNASTVAHWRREGEPKAKDTRTLPSDAIQATEKGIAWEYVFALGNQSGKDLWINVPALADDDYVRNLALLMKSTLDPSRIVYLEYSNELWNPGGSFPQSQQNRDAALAEVKLGNSPLNDFGKPTMVGDPMSAWTSATATSDTALAWRRVPNRLIQIAKIFEAVFGPGVVGGSPTSRIRPVLASQLTWDYMIEHQLRFVETYYAPVNRYIYAIAGAPYVGLANGGPPTYTSWDDLHPSATAQQVVSALDDSARQLFDRKFKADTAYLANCQNGHDGNPFDWNRIPTYNTLARCYGVKNFSYEAGFDTTADSAQAKNLDAKFRSQHLLTDGTKLSPNIYQVLQKFLGAWYGCGNDLLMYFSLSSFDGRYGTWGLYTDMRQDPAHGLDDTITAPLKPRAVVDFLQLPASSHSCGY